MPPLPLVKEPDPRLHRRAQAVEKITPEVSALIEAMIETMHVAQGVGLAANQVGSPWHLLVANPDGGQGKELVLLNARIVKRNGRNLSPEGCLSIPGISSDVSRASRVTVTGVNRQGSPVTLETEGLLAKILQHEVDHLEGRLFVDRLGFLKRRRLLAAYAALAHALKKIQV